MGDLIVLQLCLLRKKKRRSTCWTCRTPLLLIFYPPPEVTGSRVTPSLQWIIVPNLPYAMFFLPLRL